MSFLDALVEIVEDGRGHRPVPAVPEADDSQGLGGEQLQLFPGSDPCLRAPRQGDGSRDFLAVCGHAVPLHRQPDAQGAEGPGELEAAVAEVDVFGAPLGVLQVGRHDAESRFEPAGVAREETAGFVRLEEPLVGIECEAVGTLDPFEQGPGLRVQHREPAVRGVDVIPDSLVTRDFRQLGQRVDASRIRRSGGGDQAEGLKAVGAVLTDGRDETRRPDSERVVGGHGADEPGVDPGDAGSAAHRGVRLFGPVDRSPRRIPRRLPSGDDGDEVGRRAAAREEPAATFRIPHPLPEPVRDRELDLGGSGRLQPGPLEDVVAIDQKAGQHRRPGRARGDEGEEAGVVDASGKRQHVAQDGIEQFGQFAACFRWRAVQHRFGDVAGRSLPRGPIAEAGPPLHDRVHDRVSRAPHFLRVLQQPAGRNVGPGWFLDHPLTLRLSRV